MEILVLQVPRGHGISVTKSVVFQLTWLVADFSGLYATLENEVATLHLRSRFSTHHPSRFSTTVSTFRAYHYW